MKILISSHGAGLYGAERVLATLAKGLSSRNHDVIVEVPHNGPLLAHLAESDSGRVVVSNRPRLPRNIKELTSFLLGAPGALWKLYRLLRQEQPDIVWVNSMFNPLPALASKLAGVPTVWHLHERNLAGPGGALMRKSVETLATTPVIISNFVEESFSFSKKASTRSRILPNALLTQIKETPYSPSPHNSFVVGYVGQFEPRKSAPDVIEAVSTVEEAKALLVGDGKARSAVEEMITKTSASEQVELAGFQPHVASFYTRFDCLVLPYKNEPFGLVALEGMASGTPIIAADSGALKEVLGHAALYYPHGNTAELADRIRELMDNPALAQELRTKGLERVQQFTLDKFLDKVEEIAKETAKR